MNSVIEHWMSNKYTAMPATVVAYDFQNQMVDVVPDIDVMDWDIGQTTEKRPLITSVPLQFPSSLTTAITFPVPAGSKVLLVWSMRGLDNWKQNGNNKPPDYRMFDYSDAIAIAGVWPQTQAKTKHGQSPDDLVLVHNIGGSQNEIHLKANGDIVAKSPTTFKVECSSFVVDASNATINAPTAISGKTTMSAGFDSNAASTVTGGIGIDGIQFGDHRHHYDDDGNDEITGVPI